MVDQLDEDLRRAVFVQVVESEDSGLVPSEARQKAAAAYGITVEQVRKIEEEGIEKTWPPLEPCDDEGD